MDVCILASERIKNDLESDCPICMDVFDNYCLFAKCSHIICLKCHDMMTTVHKNGDYSKNKTRCPICRQDGKCILASKLDNKGNTLSTETIYQKLVHTISLVPNRRLLISGDKHLFINEITVYTAILLDIKKVKTSIKNVENAIKRALAATKTAQDATIAIKHASTKAALKATANASLEFAKVAKVAADATLDAAGITYSSLQKTLVDAKTAMETNARGNDSTMLDIVSKELADTTIEVTRVVQAADSVALTTAQASLETAKVANASMEAMFTTPETNTVQNKRPEVVLSTVPNTVPNGVPNGTGVFPSVKATIINVCVKVITIVKATFSAFKAYFGY